MTDPPKQEQPPEESLPQPADSNPPVVPPVEPFPYVQVAPVRPNNGLGVAGGVLGIVGIVLIWVPFLGGILCLLALIFGIIGTLKGRKENLPIGMAVTGIATGGVGTAIYVLFTILIIIGVLSETPSL